MPEMNRPMVEELLRYAGLASKDVSLVPYAHDPMPLIERRIAGLVDFIVDPQYRMAQAGIPAHAILLFDHGAPLPNNVAVVTTETYRARRDVLGRWLAASRRGWIRNYRDPLYYPRRLRGIALVETRTLEQEIFANQALQPLVYAATETMSLNDNLVEQTADYLERIHLPSLRENFAHFNALRALVARQPSAICPA